MKKIIALILLSYAQLLPQVKESVVNKNLYPSLFWTWQDEAIENNKTISANLSDLKSAGFKSIYAMPRATRYQLFDSEMINAVKFASEESKKEGLLFNWGADPRLASVHCIRQTGFGAEMLMVNSQFRINYSDSSGSAKQYLNECEIVNNNYSLRYEYPSRRDVHLLPDVSLWLNPIGLDKVFAYQKKDGKVISSSIKDITDSSKYFVNRGLYYVEVFGKTNLPEGEWYVIAFPRFQTNMYAFDSPQHEKEYFRLLDEYKNQNIHFDGFWWDEPGYYFQFGHYAISDRIYKDFKKKYGYDLKSKLYSLLLEMDNNSQLQLRYDYFQLLMDYVFGLEKRFWKKAESLFGNVKMGIHHTWHSLPDNMYTGTADYWRGLEAVDGGYTDDDSFERYFTGSLADKYELISSMILSSSLAKYSKTKTAYFNRWGTNYEKEVPIYWNDLIAAFSNVWIQHAYGNTGVVGASRNFGPGFPNHSTWKILPELIKKTDKIIDITKFKLPLADIAIVYPIARFLTEREPINDSMIRKLNRLVGIMPALGYQVDVISDAFLAEAKLQNGILKVKDQSYKAVVFPFAKVMSEKCWTTIRKLQEAIFPTYFVQESPELLLNGNIIKESIPVSFKINNYVDQLATSINKLGLPSMLTPLKGAYITVIPGSDDNVFLMVVPVIPNEEVSGVFSYRGKEIKVDKLNSLTIFHVSKESVVKIQ